MRKDICMDVVSKQYKITALDSTIYTIEESRAIIAKTIGASCEEIYFTTGNAKTKEMILRAVIETCKKPKKHIITTMLEDEVILKECAYLEKNGTEVTCLSPTTTGRVEVPMIEQEIKENTCLVSVTAANPETGTSEPFTGIGTLTAKQGILFYTDISYAYGRMPINVERSHIDILSASLHYLGGPDNVGFIYIRKSTGIGKLIQEENIETLRINEMAVVAHNATKDVTDYMKCMREKRNKLYHRISSEIKDVVLNGHKDHYVVNHLNVRIKCVSAAVIQSSLAKAGIQIGIGTGSNILKAIGCTNAETAESLRFALPASITQEEIDQAVDQIKEIVIDQRDIEKKI